MSIIEVPKGIKNNENRVGLTPAAVHALVKQEQGICRKVCRSWKLHK